MLKEANNASNSCMSNKQYERIITISRVFITAFCIVFLGWVLGKMCYLYYKGVKNDNLFDDRVLITVGYPHKLIVSLFIVIPIVLSVLIIVLLCKLRAKRRMM